MALSVNNPHALQNFLTEGMRANFELSDAFWRYYLNGRIVVFVLCALLHYFGGFFSWFFATVVWTIYWLWSLITLWRCAHNTEFEALFFAARAIVLVDVFLAFYNPPLFAFVLAD